MNEITRIHLAKVPFEIEIDAKKQLDDYLKDLSQFDEHKDVIEDIEIRMTEILAERGVQAHGVVSSADVAALIIQIGTPEQIAGDDAAVASSEKPSRKLYRDVDDAIIAGVASGMARYFKLDVTLVRIIFILIIVLTSGAALIGYGLLWLLIPEAKTAADKLRLDGRQVNAETLAQVSNEPPVASRRRGEIVRRILLAIFGVLALLGAIAAAVTVAVVYVPFSEYIEEVSREEWLQPQVSYVEFGLMALAGVMLSSLLGLVAYASFARKITKRMIIASIIIVAVGLTSFTAGFGLTTFGGYQTNMKLESARTERQLSVPNNFSSVTSATFSSEIEGTIEYIVDDEPRMVLEAIPGYTPEVKVDGERAEISLRAPNATTYFHSATLTVYGPALDTAIVENGALNYTATGQDNLKFTLRDEAGGSLLGAVKSLEIISGEIGDFAADGASVENVKVQTAPHGDVALGNIRTLDINYADTCPADVTPPNVTVASVAANEITLNGQTKLLQDFELPCLELEIDEGNN